MARKFVKDLSNQEIIGIARSYVARNATLSSVAQEFSISSNMVSNAMYRGVAEDILTDALTNDVIYKIVHVKEVGQFQRQQRWNQALVERQALREAKANEALSVPEEVNQNLLEVYKESEQELIHQISTYDDNLSLDPDAPSKEELESKLRRIQDKIQELQNN